MSAVYCSFCGKEKLYVHFMVGGPDVNICDECVELCVDTIANHKKELSMTEEHKPLPVSGYTTQSDAKVDLVNSFKADEERLLRKVDALFPDGVQFGGERRDRDNQREQQRWRAIARTHFQEGFSALNRAVFQPRRIRLPEDDVDNAATRRDIP